jgi:hypothetical protein
MSKFHAVLTVVWFIWAFPSMLTGLKDSTPYLVFLSVYAVVTGHFSSWQAVQAEKKVDPNVN